MTDEQSLQPSPRICADCRHVATKSSHVADGWKSWGCFAPNNVTGINLVDGHKEVRYATCVDARADGYGCGREARWFESKFEEVRKQESESQQETKVPAPISSKPKSLRQVTEHDI